MFRWSVGSVAISRLGPHELAEAVARVQHEDIHGEMGDAALAKQRGVAAIAVFSDPFGFRHELTYGLLRKPATFRPGRAMSGFVTGDGGVGHAVIVVRPMSL